MFKKSAMSNNLFIVTLLLLRQMHAMESSGEFTKEQREELDTYITPKTGVSLNAPKSMISIFPELLNRKNKQGDTVLMSALRAYLANMCNNENHGLEQIKKNSNDIDGYAKFIRFLLSQEQLDINCEGSDGATPLSLFFDPKKFDYKLHGDAYGCLLGLDYLTGQVAPLIIKHSSLNVMHTSSITKESVPCFLFKKLSSDEPELSLYAQGALHELMQHKSFCIKTLCGHISNARLLFEKFCFNMLQTQEVDNFKNLHRIFQRDWLTNEHTKVLYVTLKELNPTSRTSDDITQAKEFLEKYKLEKLSMFLNMKNSLMI